MSSSSMYDQITREHPAYQAGQRAGVDIGLRIALDALTAERVRQEQLAAGGSRLEPIAYADGVLLAVARVVARNFRRSSAGVSDSVLMHVAFQHAPAARDE